MAVVKTTNLFSNNEQITSAKLNNIMVNSSFDSGAVVPSSGLEVTAGGQMQIPNGGIKTALLETGAIDASKISTGGPSWTASSISLPNPTTITGNATVTENATVTGNATITGTTTSTGALTVGTAKMDVPSGSAPIYGCRAWVNFDGTTAANIGGTYVRDSTTVTVTTSVAHGLIVGHKVYLDFTSGSAVDGAFVVTGITSSTIFTVTHGTSGATSGNVTLNRRLIRGSGNVANVSIIGIGRYAVNFTTAFLDANYARAGFANFVNSSVAGFVGGNSTTATTAQSCDIFVGNSTNGDELNVSLVNVMFIG